MKASAQAVPISLRNIRKTHIDRIFLWTSSSSDGGSDNEKSNSETFASCCNHCFRRGGPRR
jgi:hypothetical protein